MGILFMIPLKLRGNYASTVPPSCSISPSDQTFKPNELFSHLFLVLYKKVKFLEERIMIGPGSHVTTFTKRKKGTLGDSGIQRSMREHCF